MTKSIKTHKPNTENDNVTKVKTGYGGVWDEYLNAITFRKIPVSEAFVQKMGTELVQWAMNDKKAYKLSQFFAEKGINRSTIHRWMDKHPDFKDAYEHAKEIIGNRREVGALERKLDATIVKATMHRYDPEWMEIDKYHSDLSKKVDDLKGDIKVIMQQYISEDKE